MANFARVGLLARGTVYFLMGGLAFLLAMGERQGQTTDSKGALRALLQQPLGSVFLATLALGLICYSLWRIVQGYTDSDRLGANLKGYFMRFGFMAGGLGYFALGVYAFTLIFSVQRPHTGRMEQHLAKTLLGLPLGDWLLAGVGIGVIIFGVSQFFLAWTEQFCDYIKIPRIGASYLKTICKFGLMARGFVFALVGIFFVRAAWGHNFRQAGGFKEAWQTLQMQPYGRGLVAVVALGLISYGLFSGIEAAFRRQT